MAEKNRKVRRTLSAVRTKYAERLALESADNPVVLFEGADGREYSIPHPLFADDEWAKRVDDADTTESKARAILGDDQYEQFKTHLDHRDSDIILMYMDITQATQDQLTDGRPTRS